MKLYDKFAVAKFLNMTPKNVQRLTEKGVLKPYQGNLYSLMEATHSYIKFLKESGENEGGADLNEERAKLTKVKRLNEELDLAVKQHELHKAEDIERIISKMLINFKSRLNAIPAEEADKLAVMTDKAEIFTHLNGRIKEALFELSDFESIFAEDIKEAEDGEEND